MGALALYAQRCRIYRFRHSRVWELSRFSLFAGPEFQEKVNRQKALAKPYQKWFETVSLELMTTSHPFCVFFSSEVIESVGALALCRSKRMGALALEAQKYGSISPRFVRLLNA